ncbi:hypothetical protein QS110_24640, partial [Escherichia coli]|nr:hypothetical protein [Escherichia coli]
MMTSKFLPALVSERICARANGYFFHLYDTSWILDKNTHATLVDIHHYLSGEGLNGCLRTLAFYASTQSAPHTLNIIMGTVAKLAMRQPFVLFKGLTFQKLCLPGAFRPGDHHNK